MLNASITANSDVVGAMSVRRSLPGLAREPLRVPPPHPPRRGEGDSGPPGRSRIISGMVQVARDLTSKIDEVDPEVGQAIRDEFDRQQYTLELIPSENIASPAVLQALGSLLNNKYAEGYPGKRYYGGCQNVDRIETPAIERAKALFGGEHQKLQPHCCTTAHYAVYATVLQPGDNLIGM